MIGKDGLDMNDRNLQVVMESDMAWNMPGGQKLSQSISGGNKKRIKDEISSKSSLKSFVKRNQALKT